MNLDVYVFVVITILYTCCIINILYHYLFTEPPKEKCLYEFEYIDADEGGERKRLLSEKYTAAKKVKNIDSILMLSYIYIWSLFPKILLCHFTELR